MHLIRRLFLRHCLLRNKGLVPQLKVAYSQLFAFRSISREVKTIALGSSHAHKGFFASAMTQSFNFANSSVDLRLAAGIYSYVEKFWDVSGGNVVLFYDVFSEGFQTERCSEAYKCIPYEVFYGVHTEFGDKNLQKIADRLKWCQDVLSFPVEANYRGNNDYSWFFPPNTDVEARVLAHLKHSNRGNQQSLFLNDIAELTGKQGRRFFVVLPPYRSDYSSCLKNGGCWRRGLDEFMGRHGDVRLLDFMADNDFGDEDFGDSDHLNQGGALKLTAKIVREVETT